MSFVEHESDAKILEFTSPRTSRLYRFADNFAQALKDGLSIIKETLSYEEEPFYPNANSPFRNPETSWKYDKVDGHPNHVRVIPAESVSSSNESEVASVILFPESDGS